MSQAADPFEMIKNFWANVPGMGGAGGIPGMAGMGAGAMPSFDPKDLEKRLAELKQVKQWLEMNLNMLNLQINTMEMQLTAFNSFKNEGFSMPGAGAFNTGGSPAEHAFTPPDMTQANEAAKAASAAGAEAFAQGAQALQAMPWANPGEWIKSMQAAFGQTEPAAGKSAKAARSGKSSKSSSAKSRAASKTSSHATGAAASPAKAATRSATRSAARPASASRHRGKA